ncbi:MAG: 16S rRNA (cytosine(1402)-N(4))-methyltransferase RsmH [Bacillota bacterium]
MEFSHTSVLLDESVENLLCSPGKTMVDCTLGGGGHALHVMRRILPGGRLIGLDKDKEALESATERLGEFKNAFYPVHADFVDIQSVLDSLGIAGIDGCLLDLGVSSYQLDNPDRGFSYNADAPLDMRMDRDQKLSAYDVVNGYSQKELTRIIREYGEERFAARIAARIVKQREHKPVSSTFELADTVREAIPAAARRTGPHPARRTFQAIRIEVNSELEHLEKALEAVVGVLNPGGRLCVITFHSLEDRLVKNAFSTWADPCICPKDFPECVCGKAPKGRVVTRRPIVPGKDELEQNARARSAKLRVFEKSGY